MTPTRLFFSVVFSFWLVMMSLLVRQEILEIDAAGSRVPLDYLVRLMVENEQDSHLEVLRNDALMGSFHVGASTRAGIPKDQYALRIMLNTLVELPNYAPIRLVAEVEFFVDRESLAIRRIKGWSRVRNEDESSTFDLDFEKREVSFSLGGGLDEVTWAGSFEDASKEMMAELGTAPTMQSIVLSVVDQIGRETDAPMPQASITRIKVRGEEVQVYRLLFDKDGLRADIFVNLVGQVLLVRTPFDLELRTDDDVEVPPL